MTSKTATSHIFCPHKKYKLEKEKPDQKTPFAFKSLVFKLRVPERSYQKYALFILAPFTADVLQFENSDLFHEFVLIVGPSVGLF